jgi:hypothetical protein
MSTHLDSGAFPALGIRDSQQRGHARKTPAPWDLPVRPATDPMLGAPVRTQRPAPNRARASATNMRVVEEASGPHVSAAGTGPPVVTAGAWGAFQVGLAAASALAIMLL